MKNLLTAVSAILCFALFSCQKEVDDVLSNNGNGGGNTPGLLRKMVTKDGSDSSVNIYSYNSSGQINAISTTEVSSGTTSITNETVVRNSQGIIQKIITQSSDLVQYGIDSLTSIVNYDVGSHHYISRIFKFTVLGFTAKDSTVYTYDASGKIVTMVDYIDDGAGNTQDSRLDFTYTGANMTQLKGYDLSSGTPDLQLTEALEYDTRPSPLVLGNEGFLLNNALQWISANNATKTTSTLVGDPTVHYSLVNYTYNTSNKPVSATVVADGQSGATAGYFYN